VGDYGKLERQTGEFNRKENVYDDMHDIYEDTKITELVKDHPPKVAAREDMYIAASTKSHRMKGGWRKCLTDLRAWLGTCDPKYLAHFYMPVS